MSKATRAAARRMSARAMMTLATGAVVSISGDELVRFVVHEGADGPLMPGGVLSAKYEMTMAKVIQGPLKGATVQLFLWVNGQEQPCGVFVVEEVSSEGRGRVHLSGSDSIASELAGAFADGLTYPATLGAIWAHWLGQTRYTWSGTLPNGSAVIDAKPDWNGASLRRAAGWIAQAAGCFVRVGRTGSLEVVQCRMEGAEVISTDEVLKLVDGLDDYGPVSGIRVRFDGDEAPAELSDGAGERIEICGNPLFQKDASGLGGLMRGMLDGLKGLRLGRMELEWRGDPAVGVGRRISVGSVSGVITRQTMEFDRGFRAVCTCETPSLDDAGMLRAITPEGGLNAAALVGAVDGGKLAVGSVTARAIAAKSVTAEKLAAGAITTEKLAAGSVTAEKIAAGVIEAEAIEAVAGRFGEITSETARTDELYAGLAHVIELAAGSAEIDVLKSALGEFVSMYAKVGEFDFAAAENLVSGAMVLQQGQMDTVMIRNLAVTSANLLSATLGELVLAGADGKYYQVFVGADGQIRTEEVSVSSGEIAAGQTSSGKQIVATSANVGSLNATSLQASKAVVGTILTESLNAGKITAGQALIASATIPALYTASIQAIGNSLDLSANESINLKVNAVQSAAEAAQKSANAAGSAAANAQNAANANAENLASVNQRLSEAELKITPEAITSTVASRLKVGGRNLVRGVIDNPDAAVGVTSAISAEWIGDAGAESGRCLKVTMLAAGNGFYISGAFAAGISGRLNEVLTYGADVRVESPSVMYMSLGQESGGTFNAAVSSAWQRFTHTWTVAESPYRAVIFYAAGEAQFAAGDVIYVRDLKIEEGEIATAWSPAPEDTDDRLADLSTRIDQTAGAIELRATKEELSAVSSAAGNAQNTANAAQSAAGNAQSTANAAGSAAANAQNTADAANTAAGNAQNTADAANTAAGNAQNTANAARSAAGNAQSSANAAQSTADSALSKAEQALVRVQPNQILLSVQETLRVGGTNLLPRAMYNPAHITEISQNSASGYGFAVAPGTTMVMGTTLLGLPLKRGRPYTISFTAWADTGNESYFQSLHVDLFPDTLPQWDFSTWGSGLNSVPRRFVWTFQTDHSDVENCQLRFFNDAPSPNGNGRYFEYNTYITDIKIEEGNIATQWSPAPEDPASGVVAGSEVVITKNQIRLVSPETEMAVPGQGEGEYIVRVDESGMATTYLSADEIDSPSVVPVYRGGNRTADTMGELSAILGEINGHWLKQDVDIWLGGGVTGGSLTISGVAGRGLLWIHGQNAAVLNEVVVYDCTVSVRLTDLTFNTSVVAVTANNAHIDMWSCVFNADVGVRTLYNRGDAVITVYNCTGTCRIFANAGCGVISICGPGRVYGLPEISFATGQIYSEYLLQAAPSASTPSVSTTEIWPALTTQTIRTSGAAYNGVGGALYTGDYGDSTANAASGQLRNACLWPDRSAFAGRTILSATLSITRSNGIGGGGAVSVEVWDNLSGANGVGSTGIFATASFQNGQTRNIDVTGLVQKIADGSALGLLLYNGSTGKFSGKKYTYGYARFEGASLRVVYQ